jgi:hypothetical protein
MIFTVSFNTSSLLSNNACCTVTFQTCSNNSSLIGKQVVYGLALADYQVTIKFKVEHLRVCDATIIYRQGVGINELWDDKGIRHVLCIHVQLEVLDLGKVPSIFRLKICILIQGFTF